MAKKLEVKNLRISFRTPGGKVQAVRGINFDLETGETLAIVGESGSGKSVTSKAILGILAGNAIVEGGEILYDGMDLLKISEDEYYKIRGDKIAMIFQDPLSSLNPIMRIGKQLTEAMLLKGRARQRASRNAFNSLLARLNRTMVEVSAAGDPAKAEELTQMCKNFDKFEFKHIALEKEYNAARDAASETITELENILFLIEKNAFENPVRRLREAMTIAVRAIHTYVVSGEDAETLTTEANAVRTAARAAAHAGDYSAICGSLTRIKAILENAVAKEEPNFFSQGYYLTFSGQPLPDLPVHELNQVLHEYLDEHFMLNFIDYVEASLRYSAERHDAAKRALCEALKDAIGTFGMMVETTIGSDEATARMMYHHLCRMTAQSIDPLEIHPDSIASTFTSSLRDALSVYFHGPARNIAEGKRAAKEQAKYDRYTKKKGRCPDWTPVPPVLVDMGLARDNVVGLCQRLLTHYEEVLEANAHRDFRAEAIAIIDYLKENASGVVNHLTRRMAKQKALKLMEEVGIPEPRKRYRQYPFEFSGGMRQRIVIAIALAANPDILICDEPTTALDVTIQSQILELINRLKAERHLSIIFITHDLGVVANMADKIAVMYAGKIVEYGTSNEVFYSPAHPYTWALLSSMPDLDTNERLEAIPGTPPNMIYPPKGDAFADRNKYALKIDFEEEPPMFRITDTHCAATWLLHPDAPKVEPPAIVTERIARMKERSAREDAGEEEENS